MPPVGDNKIPKVLSNCFGSICGIVTPIHLQPEIHQNLPHHLKQKKSKLKHVTLNMDLTKVWSQLQERKTILKLLNDCFLDNQCQMRQ